MVLNDCGQKDVCDEIFKSVEDKFKVLHHRMDGLEEKTEEINSINNVLVELQLLTKLQREDGVKRDKTIEDMNKNQIEITNTLKTLAENLSKTDSNVDKLSKKFDEMSNDGSIKINEIIKYAIFTLIGSGVGVWLVNVLK